MPKPNVFSHITDGVTPYKDTHLHDFMVTDNCDAETDEAEADSYTHRHQFVDEDYNIHTTGPASAPSGELYHRLDGEEA